MPLIQFAREFLKQHIYTSISALLLILYAAFWRDFWIYIPSQIAKNLKPLTSARLIIILSWVIIALLIMLAWYHRKIMKAKVKKPTANEIYKSQIKLNIQRKRERLLRLQNLLDEFDKLVSSPNKTQLTQLNDWANRAEPVISPMIRYSVEFKVALMNLDNPPSYKSLEAILKSLRNPIARAIEALKLELREQ